jgi:membrane fusion protein
MTNPLKHSIAVASTVQPSAHSGTANDMRLPISSSANTARGEVATQPGAAPASTQQPLFRPESLAARQTQLYGTIRLAQPIGYTVAALAAAVLSTAVIAFLVLGSYTKRAAVTGILTPAAGVAKLIAPASGVLVQARAVEGQSVTAGQALFVLNTERYSSGEFDHGAGNGSAATQAIIAGQLAARSLLAEQDLRRAHERYSERSRAAAERLRALEGEAANLDKELTLAASRTALAQKNLQRSDQLAAAGFVSEGQQQVKQDELLAAQQNLQALERNRAALAKERIALAAELREAAQIKAREAGEAEKALALLKQEGAENSARRGLVVTAPYNGTLTAIAAQPGQMLTAGQTLAQLIPVSAGLEPSPASAADGGAQRRVRASSDLAGPAHALKNSNLIAHFYAPTRAAGFIEPGQAVKLRYAAYPYQKFGQHQGTVTSVDKTPYAPQELPPQVVAALQSASHATPEATYRITVQLAQQTIDAYGKPQSLKPGMLVEADIIQRTQRIYEWMLDPLLGFAKRTGSL